MNWADDSDAGGGEEAYPEPDPGMDEAAYDEPAGASDEDTDFDTEDDALDGETTDGEPSAEDDGETAAEEGETSADTDSGETTTGDDTAAQTDDGDEPVAHEDEPADHTGDEAIHITDDEILGTDPDANTLADDPAFEAEFPPDIDLDPRPEPIDGAPWSDASLLGSSAETGTDWHAYDAAPPMDDLFAMDGASGGDWDSLTTSDDPAVSSLARWWQPT